MDVGIDLVRLKLMGLGFDSAVLRMDWEMSS